MRVFILTSSFHKEKELSRYFQDIGIKTTHIQDKEDPIFQNFMALRTNEPHRDNDDNKNTDYLVLWEQTRLLNTKTKEKVVFDKFEEATHTSNITCALEIAGQQQVKNYEATIEGFIFPNLKTERSATSQVYAWDEMFVSGRTMKSYQAMKDAGIKNSARDLAFAHMVEDLSSIFRFDQKVNLNFHPTTTDEVISFEPFMYELFKNNEYLSLAYKNEVLGPVMNAVLNDGLFVRRASNRKQKNYWLPGLNSGIPLTPKKDALHEITFMFHDIMHFVYPDLFITDKSKEGKHKYILARLMSEAFTLVLADMLFISLMKSSSIDYDYNKRKIYPIYESREFELTVENLPQIKSLLWASVSFAVLGQEKLWRQGVAADINNVLNNVDSEGIQQLSQATNEKFDNIANQNTRFEEYKAKYQRFFQEDYRWTHNNYNSMSQKSDITAQWLIDVQKHCGNILTSSSDKSFAPNFDISVSLETQAKEIFEVMFGKLEKIIKNPQNYNLQLAYTQAVRRYMAGQIYIFYKFKTLYNDLFLTQIFQILNQTVLNETDLKNMTELYSVYIDKLTQDNFITTYDAQNYKNIFPIFEPFYVFYEQATKEDFTETIYKVFAEL